MKTNAKLLRELRRLHRTCVINDEEFTVLQKLLASNDLSAETRGRFERLFPEKTPIKRREEAEDPADFIDRLFNRIRKD